MKLATQKDVNWLKWGLGFNIVLSLIILTIVVTNLAVVATI